MSSAPCGGHLQAVCWGHLWKSLGNQSVLRDNPPRYATSAPTHSTFSIALYVPCSLLSNLSFVFLLFVIIIFLLSGQTSFFFKVKISKHLFILNVIFIVLFPLLFSPLILSPSSNHPTVLNAHEYFFLFAQSLQPLTTLHYCHPAFHPWVCPHFPR